MIAETKIFVSMFLVVFISAFLGVFLLMPLFYGHPFFDFARLGNQISALFAFFLVSSSFIASISVVSYKVHRMKLVRVEGTIFLFTFCVAFITLNALIFVFIPTYWGHTIRLTFPRDARDSYFFSLYMLFFVLLSLPPAVFSVFVYEVHKLARKWL